MGSDGSHIPAFTPVGSPRHPTTSIGAGGQRTTGAGRSAGARGAASQGTASRTAGSQGAKSRGARSRPARKTGYHRFIDYPRQNARGFRRWLPSWRLILGTFLTLVLIGVGVVVIWYSRVPIPTPSDFAEAQTTTVYYADGTTEMGTFGETNRVIVPNDEIPEHVRQAVVAAEDRSFYENPGINPAGIARALWQNLSGGNRQGGSSITQQYAERYYVGETVSDVRGKIEEAMLAVKLARIEDKDEILANYLNTIYFGRDSYGIETASRAYFGVGVADLTVSQAALLAGVIPSPNNFDPRISQEQAERRWNYVLDGMVVTGALTQAERDAQVFPTVIEFAPSDTFAGPQGYLLDMVRREVVAQGGITEAELDTTGYRIVTTIDPELQALAVAAAETTLPEDKPANLRTALVTLDRTTGAILAAYGGPDFLTIARNAVTQDMAQTGSTFKPMTLIAYLENGGSLGSRYAGTNRIPVEGFPDGVRNYGDSSYGQLDIPEATARSVNAVYAQMNVEVGPDATLDVAQRAGVCASWALAEEDCTLFDNQHVPSNVLGTASPHPLDMAQAFNTIANEGLRTEPFIVRSVEYLNGSGIAYENTQTPERVFAADVIADTTYALTQVVEHPGGTARDARAVGHPVAGKTGTSNDNISAWFIGFTRHMTTAVAMYQVGEDGNPEPISSFGGVQYVTGGSFPLDVWVAFMTPAHAGREVLQFPPRADVGEPNTPPMIAVPSVVGLSEAEATATLQGAGFVVAVQQANDPVVAEGLVVAQDPGGGEAEQGSTVTIVVSIGPGEVDVPNVVGRTENAARAELEGAGFRVTVERRAFPNVATGQVASQSPGAGSPAAPGSTVTIVVSTGPPAVTPTTEPPTPTTEPPEPPIEPPTEEPTEPPIDP